MLVEQMCAAAASLGGLTQISDSPPRKRSGRPNPLTFSARAGNRFISAPSELVFGRPAEAALGIFHFLHVEESVVNAAIAAGGVDAIVDEVMRHGTEGDKECLEYILHAEAGSSDLTFQAGLKRDCGPDGALLECRMLKEDRRAPPPAGIQVGKKAAKLNPPRGMRIDNFVRMPQVSHARLTKAHVVALRLYSTAVRSSPFPLASHPVSGGARMPYGVLHFSKALLCHGVIYPR
jgi:hypothetical protein